MRRQRLLCTVATIGLLLSAAAHAQVERVIPRPLRAEFSLSPFDSVCLFSGLNLIYDAENKALAEIGGYVERYIHTGPGPLKRRSSVDFRMELVQAAELGDEGYRLKIEKGRIRITAQRPAGIFYGVQTLLQMTVGGSAGYVVSLGEVTDVPRFGWRGLMLDASRHWFTKEEVMRYIDEMAKYKFNRFHWHLTDDQGWRIRIDSLPRLTEVGAWRAPRVGDWWSYQPQRAGEAATYGGFYTKEDIAEVIEYARQRQVTVVPEVDVPGHMLAALVAYPELACFPDEAPKQVNVGNKFYTVDQNTICVGNPKTMEYMDKIFTEVVRMFPSEYIHIGGDEAWKGFWKKCPKCQALMEREGLKDVNELQSYFIRQMERLLKSKGKKIIGWDEIHEGGLAPEATVMSWRGMQGGIDAAGQGHHVIMTPFDHCYLDLYQGEPTVEPNTYAMCRLTDAYNWDPVPAGVDPEMILGGQGNLWTESVPNFRHAEYMTWPRGWALAEVFWSDPGRKDWGNFVKRVQMRMRESVGMNGNADVNFARSMYNAVVTSQIDSLGNMSITLGTEIPGSEIRYTFDNTIPDRENGITYSGKPVTVPLNASRITVQTIDASGHTVGTLIRLDMAELKKRARKVDRAIGNLDNQ